MSFHIDRIAATKRQTIGGLGVNISRIILIIFAAIFASLNTAPVLAADTVYVMRHLQKADGQDPPLSAKGVANAAQLAELLSNASIKAIFATATRRAQETGEPLAARLGLHVTTYDPRNVEALSAAVMAASGSVLIVGHSNTVAELVARFGGAGVAPLTEQDYGTVYVVHSGTSAVNRIPLSAVTP
jgi:broad specificity phosphatase PhoE